MVSVPLCTKLEMSDINRGNILYCHSLPPACWKRGFLLAHCIANGEKRLATLLSVCTFNLPWLPGGVLMHHSGCESIAGLWCRFSIDQITGIGLQTSVPFGLVELPTFVKGIGSDICPSPCFAFSLLLELACYLQKRIAPCKAGVETLCEVHLRKTSFAVILSLGRINSLQLLAARTGGRVCPVEVCRQGSATMSASRKQQSGKHRFGCAASGWHPKLM